MRSKRSLEIINISLRRRAFNHKLLLYVQQQKMAFRSNLRAVTGDKFDYENPFPELYPIAEGIMCSVYSQAVDEIRK